MAVWVLKIKVLVHVDVRASTVGGGVSWSLFLWWSFVPPGTRQTFLSI